MMGLHSGVDTSGLTMDGVSLIFLSLCSSGPKVEVFLVKLPSLFYFIFLISRHVFVVGDGVMKFMRLC